MRHRHRLKRTNTAHPRKTTNANDKKIPKLPPHPSFPRSCFQKLIIHQPPSPAEAEKNREEEKHPLPPFPPSTRFHTHRPASAKLGRVGNGLRANDNRFFLGFIIMGRRCSAVIDPK